MIREIKIKPVLNGFICTVGCQTVVFDSRDKLLGELQVYLERPELVERAYLKGAVNPELMDNQPPQAVPMPDDPYRPVQPGYVRGAMLRKDAEPGPQTERPR